MNFLTNPTHINLHILSDSNSMGATNCFPPSPNTNKILQQWGPNLVEMNFYSLVWKRPNILMSLSYHDYYMLSLFCTKRNTGETFFITS